MYGDGMGSMGQMETAYMGRMGCMKTAQAHRGMGAAWGAWNTCQSDNKRDHPAKATQHDHPAKATHYMSEANISDPQYPYCLCCAH